MQTRSVVILSAMLAACGNLAEPVTPVPPPPVASLNGQWRFRIKVVVAWPGPCIQWLGRVYEPTIRMSQAGSFVMGQGYLDLLENEMTGTITPAKKVLLTGKLPEEGGLTHTIHELTWDGADVLSGVGTWEWHGQDVVCTRGDLEISAVRM